MNDVRRTAQRGRGVAWPIFAGLATIAAAVAVAIVGLNLIDQGGVGSESTPSPSTSPSATTPSPTATPVPTPAVTTGTGEFGPIHSMAPTDAFPNGQTCEVVDAIVNAEATNLTWRISFPEGWSTNEESTDLRSACTLFAAEPFEAPDEEAIPDTVAILTEVPPGGDFGPVGASVTSEDYTVDGVAAVRYEIEPGEGGFVTEPTVVWIIAIAGNLPAAVNDQPYLAIFTSSADPDELAEWTDIVDRMVATLHIGE